MHSVIQKSWMKIRGFSPSQIWIFLTLWMDKQDKGTIIARSKQEKSGITRKNKRYRRNWLYFNNPRENPKENVDLEPENNFTQFFVKRFRDFEEWKRVGMGLEGRRYERTSGGDDGKKNEGVLGILGFIKKSGKQQFYPIAGRPPGGNWEQPRFSRSTGFGQNFFLL